MKAPLFDADGKESGQVELPDAIFGADWNAMLVSLAYRVQVTNSKERTGSTKTRSEVRGSGRKIHRQKGTGQARQGTRRAGHRVGGGAIHGPRPRRPHMKMPKRMRRAALFSALSRKHADGEIRFVEFAEFAAPSAKEGRKALEAQGVKGKALVLHEGPESVFGSSMANLPGIKVLPGERVNIGDLFRYPQVFISTRGLAAITEVWA
ncbi:50S ribosomal protein L4 [bacterium]|nr:50S ribosomal protein L4 [bacterium]